MKFRNVDQLSDVVLDRLKIAVEEVTLKIYYVVDEYIRRFYKEWEPDVYVRTYQLFNTLIKTEARRVVNGYEAKVYLDFSQMNHDFTFLGGRWVRHNHWPEETIGEVAASGSKPHGGWQRGTKIWNSPMARLDKREREMLRGMLVRAGIPVR